MAYKTRYDDAKIKADYKPTDFEKEMRDHVYQRKIDMESASDRQEAVKKWEQGRKQWEAFREPRSDEDWQSNHYVPLTTSVIESALAEVADQNLQPLILPRGSEDEPGAMVMGNIFKYTWEVSDSQVEEFNVLKDCFIEGTGIAQEFFWKDSRMIKTTKDKKTGKYATKEVFNYDDTYLEAVKNDDFFVDEKARGFDGPYAARDCIRRYVMNIDDYRQFFKGPVWNAFDHAKLVKPGGDTNYYEWYAPPQGINHEKEVEVLWYWSIKPEDWLIVVANDVVQVMGPNPYKHKQLPFARAVDIKRTHKFYGKGEAELLESIQDEVNTLRRMIIDRNHLDIDKMFFVSSRLNLSDEDVIARPHGMIPVDDVNAAKAVEYNDIPRSVELSLKHLEDDATISTGINPRAQSLPTAGTATEAAIIKESTLKRIRMKVRLFEKEFLTRVARLRVSNILQYYPQPKLEKIVGQAGTEEYKRQIEELRAKGLIVKTDDGEMMQKRFRTIRLENKEIKSGVDGKLMEQPTSGVTFFELKPEYFMPKSTGGYDIKFEAGSTLPISKPLMQSKTMEMYDRLMPLATAGIGYDPVRLGDMLLKVNDFNPSEFHIQKAAPDETEMRMETAIELANTENRLMMQGKGIPSTGYAPVVHTQVHVAFTGSEAFQQLDQSDPKVQVFIDHIMGELMAQEERGMGGSGGQQLGARPENADNQNPLAGQQLVGGQGGANKQLRDTVPALIQGGGQAPVGV